MHVHIYIHISTGIHGGTEHIDRSDGCFHGGSLSDHSGFFGGSLSLQSGRSCGAPRHQVVGCLQDTGGGGGGGSGSCSGHCNRLVHVRLQHGARVLKSEEIYSEEGSEVLVYTALGMYVHTHMYLESEEIFAHAVIHHFFAEGRGQADVQDRRHERQASANHVDRIHQEHLYTHTHIHTHIHSHTYTYTHI